VNLAAVRGSVPQNCPFPRGQEAILVHDSQVSTIHHYCEILADITDFAKKIVE
jgi:hypothetical protein